MPQPPIRSAVRFLAIYAVVLTLLVLMALAFPIFSRARAKAQQSPSQGRAWPREMAPPPPAAGEMAMAPAAPPGAPGAAGEPGVAYAAPDLPPIPQQIIYTAEYTIKVELGQADAATQQVGSIAQQAGGFVASRNKLRTEAGNQRITITIRVPAGKFEAVLAQVEKLGKVDEGQVHREDVTREYYDLQTRLQVAQQELARLSDLMKRTGRLADIIQVEEKLSQVQSQVERLQGEFRYLKQQVALSTITVTLYEPRPAQVGSPGPFHLYYYAKGAVYSLAKVLRAIVVLVTYVVVVGWVVWLPVGIWWMVRRARRRRPPAGE
jgi:hypothetical protein